MYSLESTIPAIIYSHLISEQQIHNYPSSATAVSFTYQADWFCVLYFCDSLGK